MASHRSSSNSSPRSGDVPASLAPGVGESSTGLESIRVKISSACDSCKRRKIKCTGTQPCDRCRTSGVQCTYGSAAGRLVNGHHAFRLAHGLTHSRTTAVTYTRHLEEKVAELQALLRHQPVAESAEQQRDVQTLQETARNQMIDSLVGPEDDYVFTSATGVGGTTFHGRFAGLSMLRTIRDMCTKVAGIAEPPAGLSGEALAEAFDTISIDLPSYNRIASFALLPSRERLEATISIAMDHAMNAHHCIDRHQLDEHIHSLYDKDPEDYTPEDRRFLGLIYALMALGRRYDPNRDNLRPGSSGEMLVLNGCNYFRAARSILDASDGFDLNTIRTLLVMAIFLLSSSMASKAFEHLCIAAAHAMRMGLHVKHRVEGSPGEVREGRQVFAVLNLMDTYTSSVLGMPNILRDADLEQTIPAPEEELFDLGRSFAAREPLSPVSETILSSKLFAIQAKIIQSRFPVSKTQPGDQGKYELDLQEVADREAELESWHRELPQMSPTTMDDRVLRSQLLLRLSHASVQICLYRPFLHHLIRGGREQVNYKGYALGSACIRASMQAIWLVDTYDRHGYLHEAQWFNIYMLALAASSLMLFVLGTVEGPTVDESRLAALKAQSLLDKLAENNLSARRSRDSLSRLAEKLRSPPPMTAEPGSLSPRSQFMIAIGAVGPTQALDPSLAATDEIDIMSTDS